MNRPVPGTAENSFLDDASFEDALTVARALLSQKFRNEPGLRGSVVTDVPFAHEVLL